jgi:cation diffusion facilitator CzcD-associated flavoprotein CzcO
MEAPKIAVIGLGVTGLAALKNLLEEGFNATGYESRDTVGGLWKYTDNQEIMSVLETTVSNKKAGSRIHTQTSLILKILRLSQQPRMFKSIWRRTSSILIFYHIFSCKRGC